MNLTDLLSDLNWLAVLIAVVASIAIAAVWFPLLIVKPYAVALGREGAPAPEGDLVTNLVSNLGPLVCIAVTTVTSAVLIEALDLTTAADAVVLGLLVGVGYLTAMTFQIAINPNFPKPLLYGAINAPYFIVSSVVAATIVTSMR